MCKIIQELIEEEIYDVLVNEKIRMIKKLLDSHKFTFEEAYEFAEVNDNMAPAVLKAFGRKPA